MSAGTKTIGPWKADGATVFDADRKQLFVVTHDGLGEHARVAALAATAPELRDAVKAVADAIATSQGQARQKVDLDSLPELGDLRSLLRRCEGYGA